MRGLLVAGLVCWTFLAVSTIALAVSFIMRSWDKSSWRAPLLSILGLTAAVVLLSSGYITTQIHAAELPEDTPAEPAQQIAVQAPVLPAQVITAPVVSQQQEQPAFVEAGTVHINADGTVDIVPTQ